MTAAITSAIEQQHYDTLLATLADFRNLFAGKDVLDFGAPSGLSMQAASLLGGTARDGG